MGWQSLRSPVTSVKPYAMAVATNSRSAGSRCMCRVASSRSATDIVNDASRKPACFCEFETQEFTLSERVIKPFSTSRDNSQTLTGDNQS